MRVLVVAKERRLARRMRHNLCREGHAVDVANAAPEAEDLAIAIDYDLVVLDPEVGDGLDLLRRWRRDGLASPVLIVSRRGGVDDKVEGFNAGADDYLPRPFAWAELLARARSLLNRRRQPWVGSINAGDLVLDRSRRQVLRGGRPVELTAKELGLLEYLMLHHDRIVSREALAEHVWDDGYEARSNVIDVLIARLRRKLRPAEPKRFIVTVKGTGYMLQAGR